MWFCVQCREKVERNILEDRKIEDLCKEIMLNYEQRILDLEDSMKQKCDEKKVREIVKEEMKKNTASGGTVEGATSTKPENEIMSSVMTEVNERKNRENNIVIFGLEELGSSKLTDRIENDKRKIKEVEV